MRNPNPPKLILASGSQGRQDMMRGAGLAFDIIPADIDEYALMALHKDDEIKDVTSKLAQAKALHVSAQHPDALVIGSDQTLEFEGEILTKAKNSLDAEEKLRALRGKTHLLHSAVSVALSETIQFSLVKTARLSMHDFDDDFLMDYMTSDPKALTQCVGGYKIEGTGAWLFDAIEGDNFTIMGMPLLPLLKFLREEYGIAP